eukprot:4325849-Amphidinium_carterae.1
MRHGCPEEVLEGLTVAGECALRWFEQRRLPISPGKCQLVGSTAGIRKGLKDQFGDRGFQLESQVRHLGLEVSATRRRCGKIRKVKLGLAVSKLRRLRRLRNPGAKLVQVAGSGPLASVLWGAEVWGLTMHELMRSRRISSERCA